MYLFLTNEGDAADRALIYILEPFNATHEENDYEVRSSPRTLVYAHVNIALY